MATDQGRTSNLNGLQLVANVEKKIVPQVGHTTFRPPFTPVTIGTIVGREIGKEYMPTRKTPMHHWHEKNNAVWVDAGAWKRPFPSTSIYPDSIIFFMPMVHWCFSCRHIFFAYLPSNYCTDGNWCKRWSKSSVTNLRNNFFFNICN